MFSTKNPTAIQSQNWIVSALLALMRNKPYNSINIKDIAKEADLDRSTFYRNFLSKEDVLNYHLNHLTQEYINELSLVKNLNMLKITEVFLNFCDKNMDFIILLRNNALSNLLLEAFNNRLPNIHQLFKEQLPFIIDESSTEIALAFNAGGMWNLLMWWIDNGLTLSRDSLLHGFKEVLKFNTIEVK